MTLSAGIVLYRRTPDGVEILIAHPGGPFWAKKDEGAWSFPKGIVEEGEASLDSALREFEEETGMRLDPVAVLSLDRTRLRSGKEVVAWAVEGDLDPGDHHSGVFEMEWPPRSGKTASFPEVDRVAWVTPAEARRLLNPAQVVFVERLVSTLEA